MIRAAPQRDAIGHAWLGNCSFAFRDVPRSDQLSGFSFLFADLTGYMSTSGASSWEGMLSASHFGKWLCPATAALDIGAAFGDTSVPMAAAAGAGGLVIAFEVNPSAHIAAVSQAALNRGHGLNLLPLNIGATDQPGGKTLSGRRGGLRRLVHVPSLLADRFAGVPPHLSFIKIDVDGIDAALIHSMGPLLMCRPDCRRRPVIKVEWGAAARRAGCGKESLQLWEAASSINYTVYAVDGLTALPSCAAARRIASRPIGSYRGNGLLADLIMLPVGVSTANRMDFCPPSLPPAALAAVPSLPTPMGSLP